MARQKKNLLYTSAGDNTRFYDAWTGNDTNYDIYVTYYGNDEKKFQKYKKSAKYIEKRKGSKFQNFLSFYSRRPDIIKQYDFFFILDDDIVFKNNHHDINKMFNLSANLNLLISGPSQSSLGKISHPIIRHDRKKLLSFTNFVEVNTMLFSKIAIINLMNVMSPNLIGWGIDYLAIVFNSRYCAMNGIDISKAYAIIHDVECINPPDRSLYGESVRELVQIKNVNRREQIWIDYARKINIPSYWRGSEFSAIRKIYSA